MPQEIVRKNQGNEGSPTLIEVKGDVLHARLRYLNDLARQENKSFHSIDNNLRGYIAFSKDRLLGYLSWNSDQDGTPVIRQIFIIKDSRRNGVASLLVQHFVSRNCDNRKNSQSPFCVESPNDASIGLFKKLGYSDKLVVIQGP
jgi:GNAT superfamily N-acetyltransferase